MGGPLGVNNNNNNASYGNSYSNPYSSGGAYGNSYSPYSSGYGSSGYGSSGYGSSFGSGYGSGYGANGYNRYGMGGNSYGMNMNRGGMYNGNSYGMNRGGMYENGQAELPLGAQVEQSTQQAFFVLDQIVQAFAGFSQMLESTFHATHSSFMAMVGVAEQFGNLKNYLGQVLSIVNFITFFRDIMYRVSGRRLPATDINAASFEKYSNSVDIPKKSSRPMWIFLSLLIGLPWLLSRLLNHLKNNKQVAPKQQQKLNIRDVDFCRALYDFNPSASSELAFKKGQIIAVLSKIMDPTTQQDSQWWKGRLQNGTIGLFPSNYVEMIEKKLTPAASNASPNTFASDINAAPMVANDATMASDIIPF